MGLDRILSAGLLLSVLFYKPKAAQVSVSAQGAMEIERAKQRGVQIVSTETVEYPYFPEINYGEWASRVHPLLKQKMNTFAGEVQRRGGSVVPSPVSGAIGREYGSTTSQHYAVNRMITAIDVQVINGPSLESLYGIAVGVGFTGIGIYPEWEPFKKGMHLDVRETRIAGNPAKWSEVGGERLGVEHGFA